jgi:hypothetical protein
MSSCDWIITKILSSVWTLTYCTVGVTIWPDSNIEFIIWLDNHILSFSFKFFIWLEDNTGFIIWLYENVVVGFVG